MSWQASNCFYLKNYSKSCRYCKEMHLKTNRKLTDHSWRGTNTEKQQQQHKSNFENYFLSLFSLSFDIGTAFSGSKLKAIWFYALFFFLACNFHPVKVSYCKTKWNDPPLQKKNNRLVLSTELIMLIGTVKSFWSINSPLSEWMAKD